MKKILAMFGGAMSLAAAQAGMADPITIEGNDPAPPLAFYCGCEHSGDVLDGDCAVMMLPLSPAGQQWLSGTRFTYSWMPYGAAQAFPPEDPTEPFAHYVVPYVGPGGGLVVTVRVQKWTKELITGFPYHGIWEYDPVVCGNGTVGGWGG